MEATGNTSTGHPLPSLPRRLVDVFFSPGRLFEALAQRPVWAGALLVGAVIVLASSALIPAEVWHDVVREQMRERGVQASGNLETAANMARISGIVGGAIFWFIWAFIVAGIVTLVFSFILGDGATYKQYLSVVSHGLIIAAVGALVTVPLKIAQGSPQVTLSLGSFAGFLEEGYVKRVLNLLDLFALWGWVVIALGVSVLGQRRSWGSASAILIAFAVVVALVFGTFAGG